LPKPLTVPDFHAIIRLTEVAGWPPGRSVRKRRPPGGKSEHRHAPQGACEGSLL